MLGGVQYRQRQMAADSVGQQAGLFVDHPADHGDVLAQLAVDQAAVDVAEHFRRLELTHPAALELEHEAGGHEFQQHGDKGRRRPMPGYIGEVESNAPLVHAEIIDKITR